MTLYRSVHVRPVNLLGYLAFDDCFFWVKISDELSRLLQVPTAVCMKALTNRTRCIRTYGTIHVLFTRWLEPAASVNGFCEGAAGIVPPARAAPAQRPAHLRCRYHNSQYYGVVEDPANTTVATAMSANQVLVYLPTVDAERFLSHVQQAWIGGTTLAIDLVFPAFPTNLRHWAELLLPMLSALQNGSWAKHVQFPEHQDQLLPGVHSSTCSISTWFL